MSRVLAPKFGGLLTFAAGRGMKNSDAAALDHFTGEFRKGGQRFRDLIEIVASALDDLKKALALMGRQPPASSSSAGA